MLQSSITHQIISTEDGSHTLFVPELNETYHSKFGAVSESECVYFNNALDNFIGKKSEIKVLETGFGTGLNAFMSFLRAEKNKQHISYTSLELFPISIEIAKQLNYADVLKSSALRSVFLEMHMSKENQIQNFGEYFSFKKLFVDVQEFSTDEKFDVVFFDAFAPEVNPELWTNVVIENMFSVLNTGGVLSTYCAKGQFKRALKSAGFKVINLPGPKGKREITTALKL